MTYEQLVTLHAIVTEGTFRGAAEKLNKSQSAVSNMLKKLETEIQIELVSREEYRPKLTPAGDVFYRQATRVMQQMQQLGSVAKSLVSAQEAEVVITITATQPLKPVLDIVGAVKSEYPATHIRLSRESMGGPIEALLNNDADIVIASMDGVPVDQIDALTIASVTIMRVDHPEYEPPKRVQMKTTTDI